MAANAQLILTEPAGEILPGPPRPVVIVGTGPVGIRVAQEILRRDPQCPLVIYGGEPWTPYNRVQLSALLSGEAGLDGIQNPLEVPSDSTVVQHHNCPVVAIDPRAHAVVDALGRRQPYARLILATGSRPHIPALPGMDLPGVYRFRDMNDVQKLVARRARSRRVVVLGGGLLGLEAANGLRGAGMEVTVLEHADRLMPRQLDEVAAACLRERMMALGVRIRLGDGLKAVLGDNAVQGLRLLSGRILNCDTLVVAVGIRPDIELARQAGLSVGRGVRVDDRMCSSAQDIYAVGECCEHREQVYGLVAPGLEQAAVAAHCVLGGESRYAGSLAATRLKVAGMSVFSIGRTGEDEPASQLQAVTYADPAAGIYRKLLLERGRLVGAMAIGDWQEMNRLQEAVTETRRQWPWRLRQFRMTGLLWPGDDGASVAAWPAGTRVCHCTGVTRGQLGQAMVAGHVSVEALARATGASTVCGSCRPLLAELAGQAGVEAERGAPTLIIAGALALLGALTFLLAPAIPYPDTVQVDWRWDRLWRDGLWKQISGFSLLGLGVLISFISLRKRVAAISFGAFPLWRVLHGVMGLLAVAVLVAHTGLRLGHSLNQLLMLSFVGLLLAGALASAVIGLQHRLPPYLGRRLRAISLWSHILLLWPLPALLGFHVFKTYWF